MKKIYSIPTITIVKVRSKQALLQASFNENLGSTNRGGGDALSRRGSWDDEEDED